MPNSITECALGGEKKAWKRAFISCFKTEIPWGKHHWENSSSRKWSSVVFCSTTWRVFFFSPMFMITDICTSNTAIKHRFDIWLYAYVQVPWPGNSLHSWVLPAFRAGSCWDGGGWVQMCRPFMQLSLCRDVGMVINGYKCCVIFFLTVSSELQLKEVLAELNYNKFSVSSIHL